ncbi:hypothetical protein [Bradyrhizobium stylosanthis]|uniref:Yip1 domain-containing protein n=1 Tax=Bradyrhizobium stylosanthis TaxID=1803665 RepID=A0A560DK92_9BRAD|nr:hypothetical protein [Bradyrhizobium stylosanthis]TWA97529.1 hypothetical protein FBZ96_106588 [Bradyrhizobium stylosanthis]
MDLEKITKFAESYGRDYILMVLGILWGAPAAYVGASSSEVSTEADRNPLDPRLLSFAVISILAGMLIYATAIGEDLKLSEISLPSLLLIIPMWMFTAAVMHPIARLFGSDRGYLDTFAVCLRVMPTAFMLSSVICLIASLLVLPYFPELKSILHTAGTFLVFQLMILIVYFPLAMKRIHQTGAACQFFMAIAILLVVGTINGLYMAKNEPDVASTARVIKAGKPVAITGSQESAIR